jgi:hypothetical protein
MVKQRNADQGQAKQDEINRHPPQFNRRGSGGNGAFRQSRRRKHAKPDRKHGADQKGPT